MAWNIKQKILSLPFTKDVLEWSKRTSLPGFNNVPIYNVVSFLFYEAKRSDLNTRADSISFTFFLALFPALIFLFTLTAYLPKQWDFYKTLEQSILSVLPDPAQDYFFKDIIASLRPKAKSSFLSIGFFLAIWFASSGMLSLMKGFDKSFKHKLSFKKRTWYEEELIALFLTALMGLLLIISVVTLILGTQFIKYIFKVIKLGSLSGSVVLSLKYIILIVLFYSVIALIYRFGPSLKKPISTFSPGAIFATIVSIISSIGFSYFIDNFDTYHKVYGAISALIITLVWIRINAFILILGFELNTAIIVNRDLMLEQQKKDIEEDNYDDD